MRSGPPAALRIGFARLWRKTALIAWARLQSYASMLGKMSADISTRSTTWTAWCRRARASWTATQAERKMFRITFLVV